MSLKTLTEYNIPECKNIGGMKEAILSPSERKEGAIGIISRLLRLNNSLEKPTNNEPLITYYGVYIPCEIKKGPDEEVLHVYKNKSEALELVKRYKLARFKAFRSRQDAVSFALRGAEPVDTTDGNDNSMIGEKPYPFKAPSPQDMVALRKAIEAGLITTVRDKVWDNPRYLVSSGNTPAILQEGSRYNAMHVSAKAMNAEICNLILSTAGNPGFVQKLYGSDAEPEACKEFASILVDRYLNTPDKALNETPLHFAAKYGAEQAVEVITSFPQCNITALNKFGEQPKDIICKRTSTAGPEVARRIADMLRERYYVPVLHAEDGSGPPTIGHPFTPAEPPEINSDPLSPRYEIRAYAGPMDAGGAAHFRRQWKRPRLAPPAFRLRDLAKGLETAGRDLAQQMKVGWKEYWPFLDTFTDLQTAEGLTLLENYLKAKYQKAYTIAYNETVQNESPEDLSISRISLGNLSQLSPVRDTTLSPMSELCVAMNTCTISADRPHWKKTDPIRQRLCRQPSIKLQATILNGDLTSSMNHTVSRLLCIERTCQVFAKRIADALNFSLTAEPEVAGESLKSEAKHLQHTIFTYMDDERFQTIDFALIHSRLAQLVVYNLKRQTKDVDDLKNLEEVLEILHCSNDETVSSDDERKPLNRGSRGKMTHVIDSHVRCLASFIGEELNEELSKGPSMSENECAEVWERVSKCRCDWKTEVFERNSKKNASFRKNRSILSTSPKTESFVRRLMFDHDIGDSVGRGAGGAAGGAPSVRAGGAAVGGALGVGGAGDGRPALYTIDVSNCTATLPQISDDDSLGSEDEDLFVTASEDSGESEMEDASETDLAEPYIYGDEPSKMDRLVLEALRGAAVSREAHPCITRWRHAIELYSQEQRNSWPDVICSYLESDSSATGASWCGTPVSRAGRGPGPARAHSTPGRERDGNDTARTPSLQVSNWLRVTGPNSPRSTLAAKNVSHNVSFGF